MVYDVIIIGGGLSGLINAIVLSDKGWSVKLIEKHAYPFHKVCGEYVSREVVPFLKEINADPHTQFDLPQIHQLQISSPKGKVLDSSLESGGFGISRYAFDDFLFKIAKVKGVEVLQKTTVTAVGFNEGVSWVKTSANTIDQAKVIIGAFGKHSNIDRLLNRPFFQIKTPYIGVKHHMKFEIPENKVYLHNFYQGYCGVSRVENKVTNVCYLTTQNNLKKYGTVEEMEKLVLMKNPFLKEIFENGTKLFSEPKVISQISFQPKKAVEEHILMSGDAAGLIAPLSGNGMAMAIHAASVCSALVHQFLNNEISREELEFNYSRSWNHLFFKRLKRGKSIQSLFGRPGVSEVSLQFMRLFPFLFHSLIRSTHGKPFNPGE